MRKRTILLAVSVLCAGILIMPYTVSLFSAQHDWKAPGDVDCITCHTDMTYPGSGYMHSTLGGGSGQAYCKACHQISSGTGEGVTGAGGWDDEHAAVTVECLDCHEVAIGGLTEDVWYDDGVDALGPGSHYINITSEAHHNMTGSVTNSEGAWASEYLAGNNEACISCHTNITVETWFTFSAQTMNITANEDTWGNWTVDFRVDP